MSDKPRLLLLPPKPTVEQIIEFYRKLTGKEPTQEQIDKVKAKAVMGEREEPKEYRITPDAEEANADWPKRTKDVTLSGQ